MMLTRSLLLMAALALSACSDDMSDLEEKVAAVKAQKSRAIEPIPQIRQYEAFTYVAADRRDPFAPMVPQRNMPGGSELRPDMVRNKEPLEEFPLDALAMVGIIESGGKTYGMVRAPDKVIHRVLVKDHLGQNYGEINKISESEILITEIIPDGFGGWMQRPATLSLVQ